MSYNQIKNKVIPPSKRTAQAAQSWVAKLPNIPQWAYIPGYLTLAMLQQPLMAALQNPMPYLVGGCRQGLGRRAPQRRLPRSRFGDRSDLRSAGVDGRI
jgi:hypothetical protein